MPSSDDERRPSPEEMLARAAEEEARLGKGKLKIFFGASPGVGKTFAMLEAAQARRREGLDVVIGWIETHGRAETEALANRLTRLPPRVSEYRGIQLKELDLDAALARHPGLLLVDELAHTNVPGSRHARRWQDVEDLLAAGIDVYTTLNVQHVESLNDVVAQITGVVVRETVPDSLLELADEIELVDLPPDDLLKRLKEGKVYVPSQAERAAQNFFLKGNLIALRELALRRTAEQVDDQAAAWRRDHGIHEAWPTRERILVAVGPAPQSANLIRVAFRVADRLRAPWIALSVETPAYDRLPASEHDRVRAHLALAQRMGAETVVVRGENVGVEVLAIAREKNVSRIVVGKPTHPRWRDRLRGSMLDQIVRGSQGVDVLVTTGADAEPGRAPAQPRGPKPRVPIVEYTQALGVVALATLVCLLSRSILTLADQAMIYLLGILLVASRSTRGPAVAAATISVAALDFFFVPPYFTFAVSNVRHIVTFGVMLSVGLIVSSLTVRVRTQAASAMLRERRTAALYAMSRELVGAGGVADVARTAVPHLREVVDAPVELFLIAGGGRLAPVSTPSGGVPHPEPPAPIAKVEREQAVAQWVFEHHKPAGRGTDTLPASAGLYLPLIGGRDTLGVVGVDLEGRPIPSPAQRQLLETLVAQTALALERARLVEEASAAERRASREELRNSLLSSVSHDLRTPLAAITGAATTLLEDQETPEPVRRELLQAIFDEADRLNRLVGNLLDMTRVESGGLEVHKEWVPIEEVVGSALRRLDRVLGDRRVQVDLPRELPLLPIDPVLMEQVFINLLENAAKYTPSGASIEIGARTDEGGVTVDVADTGPGLPPGNEDRVFEKFFRGRAAPFPRGTGLGLAICKGIVQAHGGTITAENRPQGGAVFHVWIPFEGAPPSVVAEGSVEGVPPDVGVPGAPR